MDASIERHWIWRSQPRKFQLKTTKAIQSNWRHACRHTHESVNQHPKATKQRMKTRYDARVKPLTFEAGDFAHFHNPRQRRGQYHQWARLCILSRVERKINNVLYLIRFKLNGRTFIVQVDRLKKFQGEVQRIGKFQSMDVQSSKLDLTIVNQTVRETVRQ